MSYIFLENLHTYVKNYAISEFGSTETLAPVINGKITKKRKFYDKNETFPLTPLQIHEKMKRLDL